jgi:hypothetical protein
MKTPEEIIREMRESVGTSVWTRRLADELEAAMREPVGVVEEAIIGASGAFGDHKIRKSRRARWLKNKPPVGTKLFAFPPDALETAEQTMDAQDAEIERLSHAVRLAASQKLPDEMDAESREFADWQHGYKALVKLARVALAAGVKDSLTTQNGGAKADKP